MSPQGEGRLVPIPPRTRVLAPPAWPIRVLGLALLLAAALLIGAKPAEAKTPCWQKVVQDWYEDSRIDGLYERHCYTDALKHIPEDIRTYGSFEEDVKAALLRATRNSRSLAGRGNTQETETQRTLPRPGSANEPRPREGLFKEAFDELGPRNADSMPVPLMILGGLALLLIAAGAAGLISRRLKARRAAGP